MITSESLDVGSSFLHFEGIRVMFVYGHWVSVTGTKKIANPYSRYVQC